MAIAAGSVVSLKIAGTGLTIGAVSQQPPSFGTVDSGAGPYVVNWWGAGQSTVVAAAVDEILNGTNTNLMGHLVGIAGQPAASRFTVSMEFKRNAVDHVAGRSQLGIWYELAVSAVTDYTE